MTKYLQDKAFFEENYLKLNKSITKIASEVGCDRMTIWRKLKKFGVPIRTISEANSGKRNGMWKGDKVKYDALHGWIKRHKPQPKFCEQCSIIKSFDIANISGKYKRDVNDFQWLCRRCHMIMDNRLKNLHKKGAR